jgi:hypothetical protein
VLEIMQAISRRGYEVRVTPKHSLFMTMAFPKYSFDSPLQVAVGFESFLEPADSRISGAQCEMFLDVTLDVTQDVTLCLDPEKAGS